MQILCTHVLGNPGDQFGEPQSASRGSTVGATDIEDAGQGRLTRQTHAPDRLRKSRLVRRWGWSTIPDQRKPDPKRRTAVIPIFRRYQPMVRLDNSARDGQPHAHTFGLAGEKRFEDLLQFIFGNARSAIRHG